MTDIWTGTAGSWDDHFNWSTNAVPTSSDDVVIDEPSPSGGAPSIYGYAAVANSVMIGANQTGTGIGFGGSLTITAGLTLGVDSSIGLSGGSGGSLSVGGEFFDNGLLDAIVGTVTVSTKIDVSATGEIIVDSGGSVSTASLVNSGVHQSGNTVGNNDGVYVDEAVTPTSGTLKVTGLFTNTGSFGVGDFGGVNVVSIGTLKNQATGQIDIGAATVTITTLTNAGAPSGTTPGGIGVDVKSYQAGGGSFKVTGVFTNTGEFAVGHGASMTTVTIGALDNTSTGNLIIDSGVVTVATLTNAGAVAGTTSAGIGVDDGSDTNGNGRLKVTGSFVNTGDFAVGNGTATPTVTIDALDNQKTGGVDIESGAVTATTLTNEGVTIGDKVAGIGVDHDEDETGGGSLTVTGTFTNTGDLGIGNQGLESAASVAIGTLDNASGSIDLAGGSAAQAALELAHTATTWQGDISLSGDALLEMKDNGAIETIAQDGGIKIDGDRAFVADANAVDSSSALAGLKAIDGSLDLESGAAATINGALANSGLADDDAGVAVDFDDGDSDSVLTVKGVLTNNGDIGIGNKDDDGETTVTLGGLDNATRSSIGIDDADVTVKGNVANASAGTDEGIGVDLVDGATGGSLTVTGALTNSGDFGVGNASGDDTTKITLGSLDNTAKGSIGFDDAEVIIKGAVANAGVGADKGIGIGNDPDSIGDCSLMVAGKLTNSGDLVVGSSINGEKTTVELTSLDNTAKGSIGVDDAAVTVKGNVANAGVGADGGIDNGIGVDFVAGDFGGSLTISGALTNSGDFGVGNASGDKGSTTVTLGSLANSATGSVSIINATVTVEDDLTNAGVGTNRGIDVGDEDGAKGHSTLTVTKALTNSGDLDVGADGAGGGDATVSAASLTNTGLIDIDDSLATIAVKGDYKQNAGKPGLTTVDGTLSAATITISGGSLDGAGLIIGKVSNTGGDVQAGLTLSSPGVLAIGGALPGSYTQGKKGKLTEVVTGAKANQFGVIKVNGAVNLGGTLNIEALNGFKFAAGQSFEIMSFAAGHLAGTFSAIDDGSFKSATSGVKIGGGLALVAAYEKSSGRIDLDVLSTTMSVATFESEQTLLDEIGGGFAIADSAANIEKGLAKLDADVSHVDTITSSSGVIAASTATFKADEAALNKVVGGFAISDHAAKIQAAFGALEADVAHIKSVSFTGAATPVLNLTKKQAAADAPLLKKISGAYVLNVANAGATTTTGHGDGLTIADVPGDDTITGGGGHETFVFHVGFGNAVLEDFDSHLTGMGHDTVSLRKSEFGYLTAGMSQSQDLAAVLKHAIVGKGDVTILGATALHDALTIDGVTKADLSVAVGDFRFD